jgi:hypothetical protein
MNHHIQQQKGFALLLSVIVSSIVLAIGIAILQISVNQINLASTARESEIAFQTASAGVDCMWYHRNTFASQYTNSGTLSAQLIDCFGQASMSPVAVSQDNTDPDGVINNFRYQFDMGTRQQCVVLDMYVMNAYTGTGPVTKTFANEGVGNNGTKTCLANKTCTVLFSTGHNRSCASLSTSIFSVQRELTVEF